MSTTFQSPFFQSKLPTTALSIFSQMSALAETHGAVNLSQGFPDYPVAEELLSLVDRYMRKGYNQYAPMAGALPLRETLAAKVDTLYGVAVDPQEEITVTAGGTQALFTAITAVVRPGDEVIIFEPAYDSYRPSVELCGGRVVPIRLKGPDFKIDWAAVRRAITAHTRLIIINNPNNPSTKVLTRQDVEVLEQLLQESSIFVLSDEVYEHMVFDGQKHYSVLQFPGLRSRSFTVASFGKLLHATGWKMGYVVAPPSLTAEFRKVHQFNVFSVNTPMQYAIAEYLQREEHYLYLSPFFQEKRDYLTKGLDTSRFRVHNSEGTYFLLVDYSEISSQSELVFAKQMAAEYRVAAIPLSAFYSEPTEQRLLRLCFAKAIPTLQQAVDRLLKI